MANCSGAQAPTKHIQSNRKAQSNMNNEQEKPALPVALNENRETYFEKLNHYLALSLSIPERAARAMGAIIGGSTLLLTKTFIPRAIKGSASYKFTFGMFQTFLIRNVAKLDHADVDVVLQNHFMNRKLLGTSLEAAGLLTMHLSPVWVFAIASDAAKGGKVFLERLVHHLKENQVIDKTSNPESLEQILQSIHEMSMHAATAIDTPPLSKQEVKELADELRKATSSLAQNSSKLVPSFESIWQQINKVARKENLKTEQILGMLSVSAATIIHTGKGTVDALGRTSFYLVDEVLLNDYKATLNGISKSGYLNYMQQHMQPFVENAQTHFDFSQENRSQRWFKNGIRRLFKQLGLKTTFRN
ncbi:MAG: hypothetical protein COA96_01445 [SAR86 cluster bacterium]|uniref:Uncharacterized protein n=1 Tax=SAR86 cluster bacterium TaxID=2030880 RepID=A0A2A5BA06_9GAMM|nr:MAG: hypothetical protein COA96_01445 [SAR86 cluster bacterium]